MKIILSKTDLQAISRFSAVKDIRFYLNGVMLEIGNKESRLVATDGHAMGVLRLPEVFIADLKEPVQIILPSEAVARFKPKAKASKDVVLTIDAKQSDDKQYAKLEEPYSGESYSFPLIDGKFPDYRRVIPETVTAVADQFNPELLMKFYKASVDLGDKRGLMTIHHNKSEQGFGVGRAALVTLGEPRFIGVCMPWNAEEQVWSAPSWSKESLIVEEATSTETVEA